MMKDVGDQFCFFLISRGIMENEVCDFRLRDVLLELTDGLHVKARINFWDLSLSFIKQEIKW